MLQTTCTLSPLIVQKTSYGRNFAWHKAKESACCEVFDTFFLQVNLQKNDIYKERKGHLKANVKYLTHDCYLSLSSMSPSLPPSFLLTHLHQLSFFPASVFFTHLDPLPSLTLWFILPLIVEWKQRSI